MRLYYIRASLRRAADNDYPWPLTPAEAGTLVAEWDRLREGEERRLQLLDDAGGLENERNALTAEVARLQAEVERLRAEADEMRRWAEEAAHAENLNALDAQKERAAVVAWLREPGEYVDPACARLADCIERGVHRKETT